MVWLAARLVGARSAVYLHGLDLVAPNRMYQALWLLFIRRCDLLIANSSNTARLACERGIDAKRLHVIPPGTDLPGLDPGVRQRFRTAMGLGHRPMLLSVGRLTRRKGLVEFVREALPAILTQRPDTMMLVFGHDAIDALAAGADGVSQRERLLDAARDAGVEHALRLLLPCDDATLSDAYHAADVHVFPVLDVPGDVEGFGMVAIESAARGLPTVGFRVGGVPDAIIDGCTGALVAAGDYDGFAMNVLRWLDVGEDARRRCAADAQRFGWHRFDRQLRALLDKDP
jgi:phosphatidylinositol alpha-1,6-mannosyltransferase